MMLAPGMRPIRVLTVDFPPLVRDAIHEALADSDILWVGHIASSDDVLSAIEESNPTVIVTDLHVSHTSAIDILDVVRTIDTAPYVLVLSRFENDAGLWEVMRAGARGFLLEDRTNGTLLREVIRLIADGTYLIQSTRLGSTLQATDTRSPNVHPSGSALTRQEVAVLRLMAMGNTNAEIARELGIALDTAKRHVSEVMRKLGARSRVQAALLGAQDGIVGTVDREAEPDETPAQRRLA
jgi:DNA-binding NarL/FixJ family response regulator